MDVMSTTEQLLADWRAAQRALDELRLDAPGREEAEDRVHDARSAYLARVESVGERQPEPAAMAGSASGS